MCSKCVPPLPVAFHTKRHRPCPARACLLKPQVDKYDTQSAIELLRQSVDYGGW